MSGVDAGDDEAGVTHLAADLLDVAVVDVPHADQLDAGEAGTFVAAAMSWSVVSRSP